jgi:phage-related protein
LDGTNPRGSPGVPGASPPGHRSGAPCGPAGSHGSGREAPLKGFGGASVLEIVDRYDTDTYRTVYTTRFRGTLYVLHVFQKKSTKDIATMQKDIELIKRRLAAAKKHFDEGQGQ